MCSAFRTIVAAAALAALAIILLRASTNSSKATPDRSGESLARTATGVRQHALEVGGGHHGGDVPAATAMASRPDGLKTARSRPRRPTIIRRFIPFPQHRKDEMGAYSERHYGQATYQLTHPRVIVEHFTVNDSIAATYNTFAADNPDVELHELPGVCSHFVIGRDGMIVQLVSLRLRCRHTVGLNWIAIGVEHVGFSDAAVLGNRRQLQASVRLTSWLRCRYGIAVKNVIGHNESLISPYHRENVARLRTQTHADWTKANMNIYRATLRKRPSCA